MATSLFVTGAVVALRGRAGSWSAEALIGAEVLLLGLMTASYVADNDAALWFPRQDGEVGGLVGWALGSLLLGIAGKPLAWVAAISLCMAGAALLVRYTPLIYPAAWLVRQTRLAGDAWRQRRAGAAGEDGTALAGEIRLPHTANFVPAQSAPPVSPEVTPDADRPAPAARKTPQPAPHPAPDCGASRDDWQTRQGSPGPPCVCPSALPTLDILREETGLARAIDVTYLQATIVNTLAEFNVPVRVVHVESGPTVTQFGVEPLYVERSGQKRKVRVSRIVGLSDDLALALAAPAVRIEAPVPGRPYVGIEVPNPDKALVGLRGVLESPEMRKGGHLALPLGRNTSGQPVVVDLTKAPHLLIAGATGSGKSVCINAIVTGLLMQHGPETLRFVLVDPKMVELPGYNGIPHLYGKVITEVDQVMGVLTWLMLQMDDRYQLFRDLGVRNIEAYNAIMRKQKGGQPLPFIVLVIDELADLMMTAADDIERQICRLAQMARATGIHLVLATQRPSIDVITGLIKANFPSRIAFAVTSQIDSRVILDTPGAERLLGRGDMLIMRPEVAKLHRIQGCYVGDDEIGRVVSFWKTQAPEHACLIPPWNSILDQLDDDDELVQDAIEVIRGMRTCSTSMLQRKLNIGYPKAARLMEELARTGIVGADLGGGRGGRCC